MIPLPLTMAVTLGVTVVLVLIVFTVAVARRRYDLIDSFWGIGFVIVAVLAAVLASGRGDLLPQVAGAGLTAVWGVRLALHIHTRNRHRDEDPRYADILTRVGDHPRRHMFTHVYLTQAGLLWFVSLPVQVAPYGHGGPWWPIWLGIAVWAVGFFFEAVGDHQLRAFRADPANSGRVLDTGLWRYTRHPNYFGDACVWWGLYLIACHTWAGAATVLSPLVMTLLLARGTGKPLLERGITDRRPGYADYIARTSGFVPLPPRRARHAGKVR